MARPVQEFTFTFNDIAALTGLSLNSLYQARRRKQREPDNLESVVKFVARHFGVAPENVMTCGDTGNDLDMMRAELGFKSIAVGNAAQELKQFQGPNVYHARACYAAGIKEGLEAYKWL